MNGTDFITRLVLSAFLGVLIGLERQFTGHPGGIRTNALVCLGACMFSLYPELVNTPDETPMATQIISGIGFLCSAIIFKDGANVRGLNTATTIWCTAAIGVLSSSHNLIMPIVATGILVVINLILRPIANSVHKYVERCSDICGEDPESQRSFPTCCTYVQVKNCNPLQCLISLPIVKFHH